LLVALILLAGLSVFSCSRGGKTPQEKKAATEGATEAPSFVLADTHNHEVRLSDFRGKVILLEFWATWCPPCRATIPELIALQKKFGEKAFSVVGVSLDEGPDLSSKLEDFSRELKINYPVLLGTEEVERAYRVTSIPMTYLIDKEGNIVASYMGYVDNFQTVISGRIEKLL
jgi:thiol-disulfide isomerase/thioredoxin